MKERRRAVALSRGRRRLLVVAGLLLVAAAASGFLWVRSSDVFAVRRVSVPVLERVSEEELRRAVGGAAGVNLLRLSTKEIEARLRAIPYVRSAHVFRRFPDALEVELAEYAPVARVEGRDGVQWLVAEDGRVLEQRAETGPDAGLPLFVPEAEVWPEAGVVTGPQIVEALPLAVHLGPGGAWPAADRPVERVAVSAAGALVLVLADGAEVRLGDPSGLDDKLMVALEVLDRYSREGRSVEYVDVNVPTRVVAKPK